MAWKYENRTTEELKEIVKDLYDGKLFTSLQCKDMVMSVFMPMLFIGSGPSAPSKSENNQINRKNKLKYIEEKLQYEKETPEREEYIKNIGIVYEYISEALPRSVNGYPIFASLKILSIEDSKIFIDMYNKYIKMREKFENEWETNESLEK